MPGTPPTSSSTATRPTRSSTAPRCPRSSPPRALELGHHALALTDHDGVYGSMEFAHAARARSGCARSTAPSCSLRDGRHLTLLVRDERGWRNLCRLLTLAHAADARAPARRRRRPQRDARGGLRARRGARLPDRLRRSTACTTRPAARAARRLRPASACGSSCSALRSPATAPATARSPRSPRAWGCAASRPATSTPTHRRASRSRTPSSRSATTSRSSPASRCAAPTARTRSPRPAAMAARFADHPEAVAETRALAEQLDFDLTGDLGYRYPGVEDANGAAAALASCCGALLHERYAAASWRRCARRARSSRSCGDRDALAGRLLPAAPRDPRALARGRRGGARGPTRRARCCRRAAAAAPRSPRSSAT